MALTGNSAGCGLALAIAMTLRAAGEPLPAAMAFASAYIDLAAEGDSYESNAGRDAMTRPSLSVREDIRGLGQLYLQGRDPKATPLASPPYADIGGLPPMYVAAGAHESLLDDSRRLVAKVRAAGGVAELEVAADMQHDYLLFGCILPEARATFERIGRFIQSRTGLLGSS